MLRLIMRRGPTPGAIYELERDDITIGRGSKNVIVIRDNEVSRDHCKLMRNGDDYTVMDDGSSNGTFVNGQRAMGSAWPLRPGSVLELGDSITFEYERINLPAFGARLKTTESTNSDEAGGPARHYVAVAAGPGLGHIFPLGDIIITVGREPGNDITLPDPEVSRYHLRLRREKRGYSAEDMGSTNGTLLNGQPLTQPSLLTNKDVLRLGTMVQLEYIRQPVEADTSPLDEDTDNVVPVVPAAMARQETLHVPYSAKAMNTRMLGTGLESGALKDHILLVYDRYDWQEVAAPLILALQDFGHKVWVDQYLTYDTEAWRAAVEQAKRECSLMILVVSPQSMTNTVLKQIYRDFRIMGKPVVPLLYDSVIPLTGMLNSTHPIIYQPQEPQIAAQALADVITKYR